MVITSIWEARQKAQEHFLHFNEIEIINHTFCYCVHTVTTFIKNATIKSLVSQNSQEQISAGVNVQITEPDNKSQLQQFFWEKQRRTIRGAEDKRYDLICHGQVFMT